MSKGVKVSVIVPVYNAGDFIEKCVRSALEQTLREIEVICVDDCSADRSAEILKGIRDPRLQIIQFPENQGVSAARNAGMDAARGEFVFFLDSDDWIAPDYLEAMVGEARQWQLDQVVNTRFDEIRLNPDTRQIDSFGADGKVGGPGWYLPQFVANKIYPVVWLRLYRREFLIRNGISFPESLQASEDYYFTRLAGMICGQNRVFSGPALYHRNRTDSLSTSNHFDNILAASLFYREMVSRGIPTNGLKLFYTGQLVLDSEEKFEVTRHFFEQIEPFVNAEARLYTILDRFCLKTVLSCPDWTSFRQSFQPAMAINFILANRKPSR